MAVKRFFYEIVPVLCVSSYISLDLGVFSDGAVLQFYFFSIFLLRSGRLSWCDTPPQLLRQENQTAVC